jgi:Holliday junction resolvase RusA-like endonuclease
MNQRYIFKIPLAPIGKARARVKLNTRSGRAQSYTPQKTSEWEKDASLYLMQQYRKCVLNNEPIDKPVALHIYAFFNKPKNIRLDGEKQKHIKKPDWDNVGKIICDTMVKAGIIKDDNLIWSAQVDKLYSNQEPSVAVEVTVSI